MPSIRPKHHSTISASTAHFVPLRLRHGSEAAPMTDSIKVGPKHAKAARFHAPPSPTFAAHARNAVMVVQFVMMLWMARGLAFVASAIKSLRSQVFESRQADAQRYPTLQTLRHELHLRGLTPADARAVIAHSIASNPRLAGDVNLSGYIQQDLPLKASQAAWLKKHGKRLRQDLVALKRRQPSVFVSTNKRPFVQRFAHLDALGGGLYQTTWDQTLSSEAIKGDSAPGRASQRSHNANLAGIFHVGRLSLVRSARSDSSERLMELLAFGAAFSSQDKPFKGAIITALDGSPSKDIVTRLFGESEVDMLAQQKAALAAMFAGGNEVGVNYEDRQQRRIAEPVVLRSVMSAQGNSRQNRLQARKINASAMQTLWPEMSDRFSQSNNAAVRLVGKAMLSAQTLDAQKALLRDVDFRAAAQDTQGTARWALDALALNLEGATLSGQTFLEGRDAPLEALMLFAVLDACGRTPCVQCKSGQDRTLSLASLRIAAQAQDTFARTTPDAFDVAPLQADFTSAAARFGAGPIRDVRGAGGHVKWGFDKRGLASHPVPRALYNPERAAQQK